MQAVRSVSETRSSASGVYLILVLAYLRSLERSDLKSLGSERSCMVLGFRGLTFLARCFLMWCLWFWERSARAARLPISAGVM